MTEAHGFTADAEHLMIHGVPVQILPAYNELVVDTIRTRACTITKVCRCASPIWKIPSPADALFARKPEWHGREANRPLQRQELPLLARDRPLRRWERPWDVTP